MIHMLTPLMLIPVLLVLATIDTANVVPLDSTVEKKLHSLSPVTEIGDDAMENDDDAADAIVV